MRCPSAARGTTDLLAWAGGLALALMGARGAARYTVRLVIGKLSPRRLSGLAL